MRIPVNNAYITQRFKPSHQAYDFINAERDRNGKIIRSHVDTRVFPILPGRVSNVSITHNGFYVQVDHDHPQIKHSRYWHIQKINWRGAAINRTITDNTNVNLGWYGAQGGTGPHVHVQAIGHDGKNIDWLNNLYGTNNTGSSSPATVRSGFFKTANTKLIALDKINNLSLKLAPEGMAQDSVILPKFPNTRAYLMAAENNYLVFDYVGLINNQPVFRIWVKNIEINEEIVKRKVSEINWYDALFGAGMFAMQWIYSHYANQRNERIFSGGEIIGTNIRGQEIFVEVKNSQGKNYAKEFWTLMNKAGNLPHFWQVQVQNSNNSNPNNEFRILKTLWDNKGNILGAFIVLYGLKLVKDIFE